jgi:hypothetical protein
VTPSAYTVGIPTLVALLVVTLGAVAASAATFGGLKTVDLGASNASSAIHTAGLTVAWTPLASGTTWVLNGITLGTIGSDTFAAQENLKVTLINSSGAKICEISLVNATSAASIGIARTAINTACGITGIDFATIDRLAVAASR